jgi:hypothetical protein
MSEYEEQPWTPIRWVLAIIGLIVLTGVVIAANVAWTVWLRS